MKERPLSHSQNSDPPGLASVIRPWSQSKVCPVYLLSLWSAWTFPIFLHPPSKLPLAFIFLFIFPLALLYLYSTPCVLYLYPHNSPGNSVPLTNVSRCPLPSWLHIDSPKLRVPQRLTDWSPSGSPFPPPFIWSCGYITSLAVSLVAPAQGTLAYTRLCLTMLDGKAPSQKAKLPPLIPDCRQHVPLTCRKRGSGPQLGDFSPLGVLPLPGLPRHRLYLEGRTIPPGLGMKKQSSGGEDGASPGHRPLPMVEMCEEWNSLSVKRHSRQVLPTPESPISSSRNSTSYCFAMAGTQGGSRVAGGGGLSPAQPLPSRPEPASAHRGGEKEAAGPRRWPRPLARSLERGSAAAAAGARRGEARAGGWRAGTAVDAAPAPSSARPLRCRRSGRRGGGPRCRSGSGPSSDPKPWGGKRLRLSGGVGISAHPTHLANLDFPVPTLLESHSKSDSCHSTPPRHWPLQPPGPAYRWQVLTWVHPWLEGLHQGLDWNALPSINTPVCCGIFSHDHLASPQTHAIPPPLFLS